jgi:phage terminase large subunit GpA-like protein
VSALAETEWLCRQLAKLTTHIDIPSPSQWTERKRYLPASTTSMPGYYRFSVAPYMREIIDCMDPESPVRMVSVMKGAQIGATTLLENCVGYYIDCVKTAPMMLVTADAELAKIRVDSYIIPMLQASGLDHLIQSHDEGNQRKTGRTAKQLEWVGGGFLIPLGAVNANKLRSIPVQVLLRDEVDAWPDGRDDGDPVKLSMDRTAAFEVSRKIFSVSTPLIKGSSKIARLFEQGDQRYYHVRCLSCGHPQALRWRRTDKETGKVTGVVWETEGGRLVAGSVRYLCEQCGDAHVNEDKPRLFAEENAEWVPTAVPQTPHHRSYHLSALYSPLGMQTWEACAQSWLEAWDEQNNRSRDNAQLQVFYNNVLGVPFEQIGMKLRFEIVSSLRRHEYRYGEVPNKWAAEICGSPVLLVTAAVDVHIDNLAVAVYGWCKGRRAVLLNYWRFQGNCEDLNEPKTWGRLRDVIEATEYAGDDGRRYRIDLTMVDAGYLTDTVHRFVERYEAGVYPIRGRESPPKSSPTKEFWSTTTPSGQISWCAAVDMYKERISAALRRSWDGMSRQPEQHFNFPIDVADDQLKELTVETRREKIDKATGKRLGFEWHRPSGANNELFDLSVYCSAGLDIIAYDLCIRQLGHEQVDWDFFWGSRAA